MSETKQRVLITSALPYANGPLHFGHIAGAYLPGDCYARFKRLEGEDVLYICGSDEYGVAITLSAETAKRTPKEHVDIFHKINKDFFDQIGISFDHYSRTTCDSHQEPVYAFFNDLLKNGFIEERITDQLYSEQDERFLADRYVVGVCPKCHYENARGDECGKCGTAYEATDLLNPRSKLTGAPLVRRATKHWFILLEKLKDRLAEWIETKKWKPNVINFIRQFIKDLHARAITRDSDWGLPVPLEGAEGKVLYVWFDAPIGYISATMEWAKLQGDESKWKDYWFNPETKLVQFIGKDNIPFHAAIFPAMVMGQNLPYKLVDELPANEFYNLDGKQFSKSEGWYIDLEDFFRSYSADQIRYTIAANAPETQDSEFTWKDFQSRCNADLLGKYGNLVNRVMIFAQKNCEGKIPSPGLLEEIDNTFLKNIKMLCEESREAYDTFRLRKASQLIMELAQIGNTYFDAKHPWKDVKNPDTFPRMETTIFLCCECLKALAIVSYPIIPETASKLWKFLGFQSEIETIRSKEVLSSPLESGISLGKSEILFRKIEDTEIETEMEKLKKMSECSLKSKSLKTKPLEKIKEAIDISDFQKIDLRVGQILEATKVPKSKKLLQLTVDIGTEKRTILSGIGNRYTPEELISKKVLVVANLKPALIMGIESQGMVIAGLGEAGPELPDVPDLPVGTVVQ